MTKIALIVGTTLGGTEYVADDMAAQLTELGHETAVFLDPQLDEITTYSLWILVCSTHGAGDLPENIQPFFKQIMLFQPDLSKVKFAVCAIGDSSYDTFCQGPEKLVELFTQAGSSQCVDKIQIDVQHTPVPEEPALAWLSQWQDTI
ncbi:FMN-binding protein MioC [Shewanella intestini]|uniref:FMN-binding protein MioC n=1 Tax=Shewanella intestini TaxID=2017544 RepID=A0ABS5I594_9GAMM|nr:MULTISPECIES: FMN-binding protein MioC [Shewanella]MBR9728879.1 FMN-binding protein MioC [Shewanella intestini]MRG37055.1 FMN-binding protein MioC [Shewanella sp. XMDDZSB0408]